MKIKNIVSLSLILPGLCFLVGCKDEEPTPAAGNTALACTYYVDNGTNAYFECADFSQTTSETDATVSTFCESKNSGATSASCGPSFGSGGATYTSTGSCAYVDSSENITGRWYYVVVGDAPSETALCTNLSGTFTAD